MSFGLGSAPATFQRVRDVVLSTFKRQYALVYLDGIVVVCKTLNDHIKHTKSVLRLPKSASVPLRLKRCTLFSHRIDYSGQVIRPERLEVASHTEDAIEKLQVLNTVTELRSFLGLWNLYTRSPPNFAEKSSTLWKKLCTSKLTQNYS